MTQRILRRPEVEVCTGLSRSTLYAQMAEGTFPKPVRLGKRAVGWTDSAIAEWLESREADGPTVTYQTEPDADRGGVSNYCEAVNWIIAKDDGHLSENERGFVHDVRGHLSRSGSPTPKQAARLSSIFEKLGGRWA